MVVRILGDLGMPARADDRDLTLGSRKPVEAASTRADGVTAFKAGDEESQEVHIVV